MSVFDRLFGRRRTAHLAEAAEMRGELPRAIELWLEAGHPAEAARVMVLRGDAEVDPSRRMEHFLQAAAISPDGHAVQRDAKRRRAELTIAIARGGALSAAARQDVLGAARALEELHEPELAAEGYRLALDPDGEARALAQAGQIERLEALLTSQGDDERTARRLQGGASEIELLVSSGLRREALVAGEALARTRPDHGALRDRLHALRARELRGPVTRLVVEGREIRLVLGAEIVVGRTEGSLRVASHAVSRVHLRVARVSAGAVVSDLRSRNGTQLHGMRIEGEIPVGNGIDLQLGREVPLRVEPSGEIAGAYAIDVGGARYVAPLGPARLNVLGWSLEEGADGWVELVSGDLPAFAEGIVFAPRATLLVGDAIACRRGGEPVLRVLGS